MAPSNSYLAKISTVTKAAARNGQTNIVIPPPNPSRKDIKQTLRQMSLLCSMCRAAEKPGFKRCASCGALYCSRECQKAHWPRHKIGCRFSGTHDINIAKFTQIFMANDALRTFIEILLVLELDLLNNPIPPEKIFRTQVITTFEPTRVEDFFSLFHGSAVIDSTSMRGMLQLCGISSNEKDQWDTFETEEVEECRKEQALQRKGTFWMGTIQWLRDVGNHLDLSNSMVILTRLSLELARKTVTFDIPTQDGKSVRKPLSKETCIEMINALIRRDTTDRWMLCVDLHEKDKRWFKEAAVCNTDEPFVEFSPAMFSKHMKDKIGREAAFSQATHISS